jgi:hypothetical protein
MRFYTKGHGYYCGIGMIRIAYMSVSRRSTRREPKPSRGERRS